MIKKSHKKIYKNILNESNPLFILPHEKIYKNILNESTIWLDFEKYNRDAGTGGVKSQNGFLDKKKLEIRKEGFCVS